MNNYAKVGFGMESKLKGRSFLTLKDYTTEEIQFLIDLSASLKAKKQAGVYEYNMKGKNIALIFEKPSTRTRCAFTVACNDEGAFPEFLGKNDIQLGHKESVEDTARVLGRMFDGIEFRGSCQNTVEKLAEYSGVPVWNGLTDIDHPTQVLADLLTIKEQFGTIEGKKFVYIGDGRNNMANALMIGAAKMGMLFVIASPKALFPLESLVDECRAFAELSKGTITITDDLYEAVLGADVLYTDVWCSMGEEDKAKERIELLSPYQINQQVVEATKNDKTIVLHCLPAIKDKEITEEVFENNATVIFDEAENRMHTIKAIMVETL